MPFLVVLQIFPQILYMMYSVLFSYKIYWKRFGHAMFMCSAGTMEPMKISCYSTAFRVRFISLICSQILISLLLQVKFLGPIQPFLECSQTCFRWQLARYYYHTSNANDFSKLALIFMNLILCDVFMQQFGALPVMPVQAMTQQVVYLCIL